MSVIHTAVTVSQGDRAYILICADLKPIQSHTLVMSRLAARHQHKRSPQFEERQCSLLLIGRVDRIHKSFLAGFPLLLVVSLFSTTPPPHCERGVFTLLKYDFVSHTLICSGLFVADGMDVFQRL